MQRNEKVKIRKLIEELNEKLVTLNDDMQRIRILGKIEGLKLILDEF